MLEPSALPPLRPRKPLRHLLTSLALPLATLGQWVPCAQAQLPFMALTGDGTTGTLMENGEADGYRFQTEGSPLTVNWLGLYDAANNDETGTVGDGLQASHRVSIWLESDGTLVTQTIVLTTDALVGNFRGHNITPVILAANTGYVIAADYGETGDRQWEGADTAEWGIYGGISNIEGRYGVPGAGMPTDPWGVIVGPNFGGEGPAPPAFRWKGANGSHWTDVANWDNTVPGPGNVATFSNSPTAGATVKLDTDVTVAGLTFNNLVTNQTIAPTIAETLTLESGSLVTVDAGSHSISANVDITSGTKLGPGTVNLSGTVTAHHEGAGNIAMFVSDGALRISGSTTVDPSKRVRVDGSGILEVTGVLNTAGQVMPVGSGDSTDTATLILKGSGQWNQTHTGGGDFAIGIAGANNGRLIIQDTAQLNSTFLSVALFGPGTGTVQQNGGTVTLVTTSANYTNLGRPALMLGLAGSADYHLNGGTLNCGSIGGGGINLGGGGSGQLYLNGGTLVANMDDLIIIDPVGDLSALVGQNSFMQGLERVVVQSGAVIDTAGHIITIDQNLEHDTDGPAIDGGLTKQGLGTLKLLQTSSYTGPTKVQGGTLACATAASMAPTALEIDAAAKVDLAYIGNRNIPKLKIGVDVKRPGVYGSSSSPAPLANQDDVHFAGTGTVTVDGSSGFTNWADANNATGQTPGQDHDKDGVQNGIEYFMGQTGSSLTAMPGLDGTNTVTWPMDPAYNGTYEVQTSPDFAIWTNVVPKPVPSGGSVRYTIPTGALGGKSFVRLLVTPMP